ncbi:hypothetical protein [Litoribacillus peritrichatus]
MSISLINSEVEFDLDVNHGNEQRLRIIEALEAEIAHFTLAMDAIQTLPSSKDESMPEAFNAYTNLIESYRHMISVREEIIKNLKRKNT